MLSFGVLVEDLLGKFMNISQFRIMRSYLVGLEKFCYYLPFTHVNLNETTYIEYFKHPVSRSQ